MKTRLDDAGEDDAGEFDVFISYSAEGDSTLHENLLRLFSGANASFGDLAPTNIVIDGIDEDALADATPIDLDAAGADCQWLDAALSGAADEVGTTRRPVGPVVCAVVAAIGRLLPATDRDRYVEEFRAELADLPRRSRLAYVLRQLGRAPATRRGLTERLPRPAADGRSQ